jgi:hypothetical protein
LLSSRFINEKEEELLKIRRKSLCINEEREELLKMRGGRRLEEEEQSL